MDYIDLLMNEKYNKIEVIRKFYLSYDDNIWKKYPISDLIVLEDQLLKILQDYSVDEMITILDDGTEMIPLINAANIPQFSDINSIDILLPFVEANAGPNCSYTLIGSYFNKDSKAGAQTKYGENHYKTAMLMGLTVKKKPFDITPLGRTYMKLPSNKLKKIKPLLYLRIPLIRHILIKARYETVNVYDIMIKHLSDKTTKRRLSNIKNMVQTLVSYSSNEVNYDINIKWM